MKIKNIILLLLRVLIGGLLIVKGFDKLTNIDGVIGFFSNLKLPATAAWLVALGEFVGGIMVLLGIYAQVGAIFIAIIMVGAYYFTSHLLALGVLIGSLIILAKGSGSYAVIPCKCNDKICK